MKIVLCVLLYMFGNIKNMGKKKKKKKTIYGQRKILLKV